MCGQWWVVGNIGQLSQLQPEDSFVNVGVTRQPRSCSRAWTLGATDQAPAHQPCSGVLRSQGMSGDVFVIKWELSSGLPQYAKLLGTRNSHEEATDSAATEDGGVLISMAVIAPFSIYKGTAHDTLGLVRGGRANAPGCRIENRQMVYLDAFVAQDMGLVVIGNATSPDEIPSVDMPAYLRTAGSASCANMPHAPFFESGMFTKVVDGLVPGPV